MTLKTLPASSQTAYDVTGPVDGEAIVLIHGLGLNRLIWQSFIPHLAKAYRVLSYDLYGHGESDPAPETPSLSLFARQIDEVMEHAGISSAHIIGFSIGGMINRRLAMDFPHRCKSLLILNSPHDRGEEAQQQVEARALKVQDEGKMATLPAALERWFTASFRSDHPEVLEKVKDWRQITDTKSYAGAAWVLAHGVRELINPVPPVDAPACIITTANDTGSTPTMAQKIADEIKHARLVILPELQHLGLLENPEAFISVIDDFLATLRKDIS